MIRRNTMGEEETRSTEETPDTIQELGRELVEKGKQVIIEQAKRAVEDLTEAGGQAAAMGKEILSQMADVGLLYATGQIEEGDADSAISNLTRALENLAAGVQNAAQAAAYRRAKATFDGLKTVLLSVVTIGLQIGVQALSAQMGSWTDRLA
jgi:polyhydroxyalkanoate synthesis regulator phasin